MKKKSRLITKKFDKKQNVNTVQKNIEFRKSKKQKRINYFIRTTFIITVTVVSGMFISAYMKNDNKTKTINLTNKKLNTKFENKKIISKKEILENNKHALNKIEKGIVVIKNGNKKRLGVVYRDDGHIITCSDNINLKENIEIQFFNKVIRHGEFIGKDSLSKIGVIKVDVGEIDFPDIIDNTSKGDRVIIIEEKSKLGDVEIFQGSVEGIHKKIFGNSNTSIKGKSLINVIITNVLRREETDNIFMYNESGNLIGINFAPKVKLSPEITYSALKITEVQEIVENILNNNNTVIKNIGIMGKGTVPTSNDGVKGLYIQKVCKGSIGEIAKIRPTDIILAVNDKEIKDLAQLVEIVSNHKKDDRLILKIWRNGEIIYNDISAYSLK
ncbi:S1C family serine protease [Hathewaya histolytica]|uniref:S1C family serine protease n=1 Tax=Hathewaya histolytica TaxID=1498 RepID=UPI003B684B45